MDNLLAIIIGSIFVNNFVLSRFLGICPFIGVSRRTQPAVGMGLAVTFVMGIASFISWAVYNLVLVPFQLEFLKILSFILVIASLVQLVELFMKRYSQPLYRTLGIYLPLITTNCAILGVAFLNVQEDYSLLGAVVSGISAGMGFTLALLLMSGIRERLDMGTVPDSFKGTPIAFLTAALMSLAFLAFSGMIR
jgi:electron transport complex protein RnfA